MSQSPLIVKYEKVLLDDPRSRAFAPLAEAYRKVGLLDKAFDVLKKGIRFNPDYLMGYLSLAQCYFEKEEYSLAYTTLRPIAAKNRDNLKLQKLYGEVCFKTQNLEEALDTYKYMLFLNPKDEEISSKVTLLEGELSESAVSNSRAEVTFAIDELNPSPENDRALDDWIQVDLSRQDSEDELAEEDSDWQEVLVESEPEATGPIVETDVGEEIEDDQDDTPVITHTLVDLYLSQGHTAKAIEILEKIVSIQPDNQESVNRLRSLLAQNKNVDSESLETPQDSSDDEGHSNLMAVFDETLSQGAVEDEKVDEVLSDFLALLRTKSDEYSLKE